MNEDNGFCSDCDHDFSRRDFVKAAGAAALTLGASPLLPRAFAAPTAKSTAETAVGRFYNTLSDEQKKEICFPFGHELRKKIHANWSVTEPRIEDDFYTDEQRKLTREIVKAITSEDGFDRLEEQMEDDWGGFGKYKLAVFGKPGSGKFQWELTGRHLTLRADGDSVDRAAFGGGIIYGHGASDPAKNLFHYQTKQANEVFGALDTKQREKALLDMPTKENPKLVAIRGERAKFAGVSVSELSDDQKELVEKTIKVMLAPYRKEDVEESLAILKKGGGLEQLHIAFYKQGDLKKDNVWDIWRLEGPTFAWHFRGAPHVHTYVNIGVKDS